MKRNKTINRRQAMGVLAGAAVLGAGLRANAQTGQIKIIFPYAAGGSGDALCRLIADKMTASLGQTVIVEDRTGGAGRIGVSAVKNAAPDGQTVLITPFAAMTIFPHVYRTLDYNPFTDFAPVSQLVTFDFGIATGPTVPAKTPQELVAWLRKNPDKAQYGSPGAGALPHFFGLQFGKAIGVPMTHVAYKGTAPALTDLVGGQIPMVSSTVSDLNELHKAGKIHLVATSGTERTPLTPDIPTFKESGVDIVGKGWYGAFVPAGTPADVIARLNKAMVAAVADPDVNKRLVAFSFRTTATSPEELGKIQKAESDMWGPVVKASGFHAD
jgi:tripartite-type tricarboxylate transporter receptor subunit TctC